METAQPTNRKRSFIKDTRLQTSDVTIYFQSNIEHIKDANVENHLICVRKNTFDNFQFACD